MIQIFILPIKNEKKLKGCRTGALMNSKTFGLTKRWSDLTSEQTTMRRHANLRKK
jgi:hypothetical protein